MVKAVDCGGGPESKGPARIYDDTPISSPGCLYAYGIYPVGEGCQTTFFKVIKNIKYSPWKPKNLSKLC